MLEPISLFKLQKKAYQTNLPFIARLISRLNLIINGVDIGIHAQIGDGFSIHHGVGLVIGDAVSMGGGCTCFQGVTIGTRSLKLIQNGIKERSPIIGERVIIYAGALVLGPILVGNDAIIGANAVVMKDVPSSTTVPAGSVCREEF